MTRTVLARQLKAGDTIYVSGKMVYSHITRKIEMGTPEFEKANQRKIAQGAEPATASYIIDDFTSVNQNQKRRRIQIRIWRHRC